MIAWTSPLPTDEVDPLEDVALGVGDGGDVEVPDLEVLVAHGWGWLLWWVAPARPAGARGRSDGDGVRPRGRRASRAR